MNRRGVSFKISSGIGIIVAVTLIAGITALATLQSLQSGYQHIAENNIPRLVESGKMLGTVRSLEAKGVEMASAPNAIDLNRIYHQAQDLRTVLTTSIDQMAGARPNDSSRNTSEQGQDSKEFSLIREQLDLLDANFARLKDIVESRIEAERAFHHTFQAMLNNQDQQKGFATLWHLEHAAEHSDQGQRWIEIQQQILSQLNGLHNTDSRARLRLLSAELSKMHGNAEQIFKDLSAAEKEHFSGLQQLVQKAMESENGVLQRRKQLLALRSSQEGVLNANRQITTLLVSEVSDVFTTEHQQVLKDNKTFDDLATSRASLMIILAISSLVMALIIVAYLHQSVLRRLDSLKERMLASVRTISQDENAGIDVKGDEITEIGAVLDHFYDQIKEREDRLRHARDEAEQLAVKAEAANRAKSTFLANMSHELRTPLNAIIGFSEIIKSGMRKGYEAEYADDIHQSGTHLLNLINGILELSKIEAGKHELDHEPVDVSAVTQEAQRFFSIPAREKDLEISCDFDANSIIRADEMAIKQILVNLISNAVKFTDKTGRIQVLGRREDPVFVIQVTDTGIGIAKSELNKVVEPFHQGKESYDDNVAGTGLGLTIVRNLVELHGGTMEIISEKGKGTTVTIRLPVDVDAPALPGNRAPGST